MRELVLKSRLRHRAKPFGLWQILLLGLSILAVSAVAYLYVQIKLTETQVAEAQANFQENLVKLNHIVTLLAKIEKEGKLDRPTPETIRTSLVKFEQDYLTPAREAQLAVIREVNVLAKQSNVALSEIGFDSVEQKALEEGDAGQRTAKSLFPGLQMSFTVEGSYADVRRFLITLERSRAFVIINSLDLKSVEGPQAGGRSRFNSGAATDQVVALGVKLVVYYQREEP